MIRSNFPVNKKKIKKFLDLLCSQNFLGIDSRPLSLPQN